MNGIITAAGFYPLDRQWGLFVTVEDEDYFVPTDKSSCLILIAAGIPEIPKEE